MVCTMGSWSDHGNRTNESVSKWLLREEVIQQWRQEALQCLNPQSHVVVLLLGRGGGGLELQSDKRVPETHCHGGTEWSALLLWL